MAFVADQNTVRSGTGSWTLVIPSDATIAVDDPPTRPPIPASGVVPDADFASFPTVKLVINIRNDQPSTISVIGDASTQWPNPPDSLGFTVNLEIDVINDTGHTLPGVTFTLANTGQQLPYILVPGVVDYGESVNANYAYFTRVQPVSGETVALYDPTGKTTTQTATAASQMTLVGNIAPGTMVSSSSVLHNTELTALNDFTLTVTDAPVPTVSVLDTSTGQSVPASAQTYTGAVAGVQEQYINLTADNVNINALTPNWFIHSGSGMDAIAVVSGTNVLDGSTGSNFLVGGSGTDTFFVDDRRPSSDIWSTVSGFHAGDAATIWGVTPQDFDLSWVDGQGASGYTGLTLHATAPGKPNASLTLAGYTGADLGNGRLSVNFGTDPASGSAYMFIHGNT
ncbi:MAG TPA: hypothetical protein VH855_01660 [Acetobacteraceae bacterium]